MSFSSLQLLPLLVKQLTRLGYEQPTPIQQQAIPVVLSGKDVLAGAQTGTGKTAAFTLPIIQMLLQSKAMAPQVNDSVDDKQDALANYTQTLILVPTRELAQQVHQHVEKYASGTDIRSVIVYGGVSIKAQANAIQAGADIIVATPGRLLDHLRNRVMSLSKLKHLVFDEADRMLDMGFRDEIIEVLKRVPKERQTLLFSATLDERIFKFSKRLLDSPQVIETHQRNSTAASIVERVYNVDSKRKLSLLSHLIKKEDWQQALIFSRTKQGADKVAAQLQQAGVNAAAFHADLSQAVRESVLTQFKSGEINALVATDVAARGLDINELNYVVNIELPFQNEDYIHRIGRTGRAGNTGQAITLLSVDDEPQLIKLEAFLDRRLPQQWLPGFEPDLTQVAPVTRKTKKGSLKQQARQKALAKSKRK
ncbi:ATP-dependent RNA helicase RhlE [Shewanella sp. P1-14-1]|uniref:DEAD/DEAH box helicase n=1 Tax=Shewanella sp. P1-14-1 TaxID=1723761 RepID=UPI0006D67BB6|nr:DEAD/DEAH box helicase [Shewanella sp. P1-14-1]KPZ70073.1 ATP-dependent RNA helicase RhlE [Shewanella sp. P1-14-1]